MQPSILSSSLSPLRWKRLAVANMSMSYCRSGSGGSNMPKKETSDKTVRVTLVRSPIGYTKDQKETVLALGLRRIHQTVEHKDNPAVRGMIRKIIHLVQVEE